MTATATADPKAGFCSVCRRGSHVLCSSSSCDCFSDKPHPSRPGMAPQPPPPAKRVPATPPPSPAKTVAKSERVAAELTKPVFGLVREDPPTLTRGRRSYAEDVLPVLADIEEADSDEWFRVAVFPSKGAAGRARTVTVKQLGDKAAAWEFQAVSKPPGSALYARRVDS